MIVNFKDYIDKSFCDAKLEVTAQRVDVGQLVNVLQSNCDYDLLVSWVSPLEVWSQNNILYAHYRFHTEPGFLYLLLYKDSIVGYAINNI